MSLSNENKNFSRVKIEKKVVSFYCFIFKKFQNEKNSVLVKNSIKINSFISIIIFHQIKKKIYQSGKEMVIYSVFGNF
jgi:hypothetical protein